jgi:hypothetical protein
MKTAVDRFGRVVLPKQIRDALGLVLVPPWRSTRKETPCGSVLRWAASVLAEHSGVLVFEERRWVMCGSSQAQREARTSVPVGWSVHENSFAPPPWWRPW